MKFRTALSVGMLLACVSTFLSHRAYASGDGLSAGNIVVTPFADIIAPTTGDLFFIFISNATGAVAPISIDESSLHSVTVKIPFRNDGFYIGAIVTLQGDYLLGDAHGVGATGVGQQFFSLLDSTPKSLDPYSLDYAGTCNWTDHFPVFAKTTPTIVYSVGNYDYEGEYAFVKNWEVPSVIGIYY